MLNLGVELKPALSGEVGLISFNLKFRMFIDYGIFGNGPKFQLIRSEKSLSARI